MTDLAYTARIESADGHLKAYAEKPTGNFSRQILSTTQAAITLPNCDCIEVELWSDEVVLEYNGEVLWRGPITNAQRNEGGLICDAVDISGYLDRTVVDTYDEYGDYSWLMWGLARSTWLVDRMPVIATSSGYNGQFDWKEPQYLSPLLGDLETAGILWQAIGPNLIVGPDPIYEAPTGPFVPANTQAVGIELLDVVRRCVVLSSMEDPDDPDADRITFWGSYGGTGPDLLIENQTVPDEASAIRLAKRYVDAPDQARATVTLDTERTPVETLIPGRSVSIVSDDCWSLENGMLESVAWDLQLDDNGGQDAEVIATVIIGDLAEGASGIGGTPSPAEVVEEPPPLED